MNEATTIKLLRPVAVALDYAHSQGVVHRDVKPGNVMTHCCLWRRMRPKLFVKKLVKRQRKNVINKSLIRRLLSKIICANNINNNET